MGGVCPCRGPSMETARARRYWLVFTMIIENLFFSAVLLGWSSLQPVLLEEGFFSNSCPSYDDDDKFINGTQSPEDLFPSNASTPFPGEPPRYGRPVYPRCAEQDANMNLAFTVGSFLLSGLTFPIGMILDKFGCRWLRMVGSTMFITSCLLFGWASVESSWLLFPAVALNGVGGIILTFTSFQIANLFGTKRSTVISLNIGSYASAAILFLILKALYDLGLSRQQIFTGVAIACVFTIINCYINVPLEPIPDPEGATFGMHWNILGVNHKLTGQKFHNIVQTVGRRLSVDQDKTQEDIFSATYQNMNRKNSKMYSSQELLPTIARFRQKNSALTSIKKAVMPLLKSVWSPIYMLSVVTMCVVQLRLLFFIGSLSQMLFGLTDEDQSPLDRKHQVDQYVYFFGIMQLMCLVTSPLIGAVMDFKIKETLANARKEKEMKRKQSLIAQTSGSFIKRNHSAASLGKTRNASTGSFGNGYLGNGGLPSINGAIQNGTEANGGQPFKTRHLSLANMKTYGESHGEPLTRMPYAPSGSPSQGRPVFTLNEDDSPRGTPSLQDSPRRSSSMKDSPKKRSVSTTDAPKGCNRVPATKTRHLSLGNILKSDEHQRFRNSSTGEKPRRFSLASFRSRRASSEDSFSMKPPMSLKIRKLINGSLAFGITCFLMGIFGVTVLVENLHVQVLSFVLHTIIRGFIHSACCGLYAITYPADQVGSLIGLQSMISACATLLQYPIFIAIEGSLGGDPRLINLVLLGVSLLAFGLPVYMMYYAKKLRRKQKSDADAEGRLASSSSKVLEPLLEDGIEGNSEDDVFFDEEEGLAKNMSHV